MKITPEEARKLYYESSLPATEKEMEAVYARIRAVAGDRQRTLVIQMEVLEDRLPSVRQQLREDGFKTRLEWDDGHPVRIHVEF